MLHGLQIRRCNRWCNADLINVHDAALGDLEVVRAALQQLVQDGLHVVAHIAGLRQRGRIRHRKGDLHQPRQRLCQQRLPRACAHPPSSVLRHACWLHYLRAALLVLQCAINREECTVHNTKQQHGSILYMLCR